MQRFIKVDTLEYPIYEHDIRVRHPRVSFPVTISVDAVENFGYKLVHPTEQPVGDVVIETQPTELNGEYHQTWTVRPFNSAESAQRINQQREETIANGIEYTFPNGQLDRVQVFDRDLTILTKIEMNARANLDTEGYIQPFRSMSNNTYFLTAQEVLDMTTTVFNSLHQIYVDSWAAKDALA